MTRLLDGRTTLLEQVRGDLVGPAHMVALWGAPGVGKTWLAEQGAASSVVVDAAGLDDLGQIVDGLGEHEIVVLDGLDRWLERDDAGLQCALQQWLDAGARRLVTTHRRRWTPPFARAIEVVPLDHADAMALFLAEVERLHSPSAPSEDEQAAVRDVLPILDGIPRAILWAAARWGILGTDGLVERLQDAASHPLRADVEAMVARLPDDARSVLGQLTSFAGDFTPDDAETVVACDDDVVGHLARLHGEALLHRLAPGRFRVFSAVRQVVAADPACAERHALWCLGRIDPEDRPPASRVPDLLQAARWLVSRGDPRAGTVLVALAAAEPGRHLDLVEEARQRVPSPDVFRAHSRILRLRGRHAEAARALREGLALAGADVAAAGPLWRHWGVLHHKTGDWAEARAGYEQALSCARELSDVYGVAAATANLGTIEHDRCAYEDAEQRYAEALSALQGVEAPRLQLTVRANQAVLWQEIGKLDDAERAYRQSLVLLERAEHPYMLAITWGNLGLLLHEQARLEESEAALRQALEQLAPIEDPRTEALCLARLAAVHADRQRPAAADSAWEAATWTAQRADAATEQVVELFGAFVDLVHDRDAAARARLGAAEGVLQLSGDARIAARILRLRLSAAPATLQVEEDGFVPPGGERVDLSRHASIRRMFHALVQTAHHPDRTLDVAALFEAGWPDERINPESMRNRVHVNLAKLRRWGLKTLIERSDDGYRLQATVVTASG